MATNVDAITSRTAVIGGRTVTVTASQPRTTQPVVRLPLTTTQRARALAASRAYANLHNVDLTTVHAIAAPGGKYVVGTPAKGASATPFQGMSNNRTYTPPKSAPRLSVIVKPPVKKRPTATGTGGSAGGNPSSVEGGTAGSVAGTDPAGVSYLRLLLIAGGLVALVVVLRRRRRG